TGSGTLTKTGIGTFRYNSAAASTFGKLVVTGGLYQSNSDGGFGAVPAPAMSDNITLNGGGISVNNGAAGVVLNANRGINLTGAGLIDISNALTYAGAISGTGPLTINAQNAGSLINLSGNNTYSGGTTIQINASAANSGISLGS